MRQNKQNILVTRSLSGQQREYARILGLNPIEKPALEFEFPTYWDRVLEVINAHRKSAWVFTSSNAVKALEKLIKSGLQVRPEVQLFAVGSKTQEALLKLGLEAQIPHIQDGIHLAKLLIQEAKINSVIYFHGNIRRNDLTNMLAEHAIEVIELEVYKTEIHPVILPEEPVQAILFYSPSAVEGFRKGQGFDERLPTLFAIGTTTADALQNETNQPIQIADKPDTKMLLQAVSTHLFKKENVE